MEGIKTYKTTLHFPENIPLILHISKKGSSLYLKDFLVKSINNDELTGFSEEYDGKKFAAYIKEDADGSKALVSKMFGYKFDTLFNNKTLIDIIKEDNIVNLYFHNILIGCIPFQGEIMDIFARRNSFKGRVFSDNDIQIIRKADIHMHTENSFLDGIIKIPDLADKLEYGGAITDHGNMHGAFEFYREMTKRGKKPIIGCEVYVERLCQSTEKDKSKMDMEYARTHYYGDHLILLAKDNEGLKNLNKLVTSASMHFYGKPHVVYADLKKYSSGLIATSACMAGTLSQNVKHKRNARTYAMAIAGVISTGSIDALDNFFKTYELDWGCYEFAKKYLGNAIVSRVSKAEEDMIVLDEDALVSILADNEGGKRTSKIAIDYSKKIDESIVSELEKLIIEISDKNIRRFLKSMENLFGRDDFYIEIQRHQFKEEEEIMDEVLSLARRYGFKIVQGTDAHYLNKEDARSHEIWLCLQTKRTMFENHWTFNGTGYHVMSNDEEVELFKDIPEALDNSLEILDKCNITMGRDGKYYLPKFPLNNEDLKSEDDFENQKEYFMKKVREGFKLRFAGTDYYKNQEYLDRIKYETDTIIKMGFPSYFTIVQDFISWAEDVDVFEHWRDYYPKSVTEKYIKLADKDIADWAKMQLLNLDAIKDIEAMKRLAAEVNDEDFTLFVESATKTKKIQVGPGRGSAAGSLVAYCLGIVKVDPIPYGLLFERFLNPDRISMPDIDVDIEDIAREDVINHVRVKYGKNSVARIATEGTAAAKAVVKDVCRTTYPCFKQLEEEGLGSYDENGNFVYKNENAAIDRAKSIRAKFGDKISKTIPNTPKITLKAALEESIDFKNLYDEDENVKNIVDTAMRLEGLKKNLSIHACGVLVTDGPVTNYMPQVLVKDAKSSKEQGRVIKHWATQYQAPECEDLGCLKIDFLGLRTLSMANAAIRIANKRIRENYYTFERCSEAIQKFWKEDYENVVKSVRSKLQIKLENKKALPRAVETINVYLDEHPVAEDIKDVITLQMLAAQVDTPYTFIGKSVSDITNLREQYNMITFENIPINDENVYRFISTGSTDGVFQIESPYMKSLMQKLYQDIEENKGFDGTVGFARLCDANALGRPGPMKEIPNYINNMLHPEEIKYEDERMKQYLATTNGIITYQEQMMFMCRELAGFTGGQADTVRKGCGKKVQSILDEYGRYFLEGSVEKNIPGCVNNGLTLEVAQSIWDKMLDFGKYAFNKSHSVTYSVNSAITAWLSYYFGIEYMTSVINSYLGNASKIKGYLGVCRQRDIVIYHPDVNKSLSGFSAENDGVRFGLKGLKTVGANADPIVNERIKNGEYRNLRDFIERTTLIDAFKKNVFEALVYAGCLDSFEGTRKDKLKAADYINEYSKVYKEARANGQMILSDILPIDESLSTFNIETSDEELIKKEMLEKEYHYAGFYITEHPLDSYNFFLKNKNITPIGFLQIDEDTEIEEEQNLVSGDEDEDVEDATRIKNGDKITVAAIIKEIEIKHRASDGAKFAKFRLEDQSGDISAIVFTKKYEIYEKMIQEEKIGIFEGNYQVNEFGAQIVINSIVDIESAADINVRSIYLLSDKDINIARTQFVEMRNLITAHPGEVRVFFRQTKGTFPMGNIQLDVEVLDSIYKIMNGEHNVTINHYNNNLKG